MVLISVFKCDFFHACGKILYMIYADYNPEVYMRSYRGSIYNIYLNIIKVAVHCNDNTLSCEVEAWV
jgi:hypothetical protein